MNNQSLIGQISDRIAEKPAGSIFVTADFVDLASAETANRNLLRLVQHGTLRRVIRGVYESITDQPTSPHRVAQAIARNFGWQIVPTRDTALTMLGLTRESPTIWTFVSDGPYKSYQVGDITIRFKHTAQKELSRTSYKTALIIQAIKAVGRDQMSEAELTKLANLLTPREKVALVKEAQYTTAWIHAIIKQLAKR